MAPHVYLITDRRATLGRPLVDLVKQALAGARGLRVRGEPARVAVLLREQDLSGRALVELATALRIVTADADTSLFIHDRVDVALATDADGVHLGGGSIDVADVRQIAPRLQIAVSTHSRDEILTARAAGAAFVVLGPVFDTPSKRGMGDPIGVHGLAVAVAKCSLPVLALGGITAHNAAACLAAGASGVACIRGVMAAPDPGAAIADLCASFQVISQ